MEMRPASSLLKAELLSDSSSLNSSKEHNEEDSGLVGVVDLPVALPRRSLERDSALGRVDVPLGMESDKYVAELR